MRPPTPLVPTHFLTYAKPLLPGSLNAEISAPNMTREHSHSSLGLQQLRHYETNNYHG